MSQSLKRLCKTITSYVYSHLELQGLVTNISFEKVNFQKNSLLLNVSSEDSLWDVSKNLSSHFPSKSITIKEHPPE